MISLSLAKLSTAQDVWPDEQTFQWKHETNNLVCVIDSYQTGYSALQLLKVVQGTQIRQRIELERLVNESQDLVSDMQRRGLELKGEQLPISAIVRCPLLAVRWQLPDQKIRRLQMRFRTNEDFDLVYNHLHRLGLRMLPPQSQSNDRGTTAKSEQSNGGARLPSSSTPPAAERTGPSCPPSRLSEISRRPYTAVSAPTAIESQIQESAHARPTSAFAGSSYSASNPLAPPTIFPRPDSASAISPNHFPSFPPHARAVTTVEHHDTTASRPDTTLLYERPDTADLPPRRELPFQRDSLPPSSGSDHDRPRSRPSTSFMGPPPLPHRVSDLRPGSARSAGLDNELPPLRQPTIVADTTKRPPSQPRPHTPRPSSRGHTNSGSLATIHEDLGFPRASSSPQAYQSPAAISPSGPQPLSPTSSITQNRRSVAPQDLSTSPSARCSSERNDRTLKAFSAGGNENTLNAYAMQSDDRRRAALDSFILKNLNNDDFLTLVEDVEINWARVAL